MKKLLTVIAFLQIAFVSNAQEICNTRFGQFVDNRNDKYIESEIYVCYNKKAAFNTVSIVSFKGFVLAVGKLRFLEADGSVEIYSTDLRQFYGEEYDLKGLFVQDKKTPNKIMLFVYMNDIKDGFVVSWDVR